MKTKIDFYAPMQMPAGHMIYGAAAANHRVKLMGGFNHFFETTYRSGYEAGMKATFQAMMRSGQRMR